MVMVTILWRRQTEHYPRFGPTEEDAHSCHKGPWRHAPQGIFDVLLTNTHRCWCMLCNHNRRCRSVRHCFIVTCDKQVYVQGLATPEWLQTAAALGKVHNLLLVTSAGLSEGASAAGLAVFTGELRGPADVGQHRWRNLCGMRANLLLLLGAQWGATCFCPLFNKFRQPC